MTSFTTNQELPCPHPTLTGAAIILPFSVPPVHSLLTTKGPPGVHRIAAYVL